jgi:archaellum component FlaG (FlaF/FlaG flagellin family)
VAARASRLTVTTTPVELTGADQGQSSGSSILVQAGSVTVYVGGSTVTAADGFPIAAGATLTLDLDPGELLYAVAASGSTTVHVLRTAL